MNEKIRFVTIFFAKNVQNIIAVRNRCRKVVFETGCRHLNDLPKSRQKDTIIDNKMQKEEITDGTVWQFVRKS